jgi:hypothetical protein
MTARLQRSIWASGEAAEALACRGAGTALMAEPAALARAPASAEAAALARDRAAEARHEGLEGRPEVEAELGYRTMLNGRPALATQRKSAERLAGRAPGPRPAQSAPNRTGLPDRLKAGVEALSGVSMDGVKVHYNSPKPARLQAHAFAQGSDIHLAPGQERHLPHEAWHVIQQAQGRVRPTMQMKNGVPVNEDRELEREADAMGARALARSANAGAAAGSARPLLSPGRPMQMRWIVDDARRVYFWEEDGTVRDGAPSALHAYHELTPAPARSTYYVNEGGRHRPLYLSLDRWLESRRGGQSAASSSDHYNRFGRFDSSASVVAFIPNRDLPEEARESAMARLRETVPHLAEIAASSNVLVREYPARVLTTQGDVLGIISATALGAIYSDQAPNARRASQDPGRARDPRETGVAPGSEKVKVAENRLTPKDLRYWSGEERSESQIQVMGASAADVAENAGFDRSEGLGWEWLHLIAHSMGGMRIVGPQVAGNLVCGTAECNTQMIIVEEFIKDLVARGHNARLAVFARMSDPVRHIAESITYDFLIMDDQDRPIDAFHWTFDPLSRLQPIVEENRGLRYVARALLAGRTGKDLRPEGKSSDEEEEKGGVEQPGPADILRARGLIIGDSNGAENICLLDTLQQLLETAGHQISIDDLLTFFWNAGIVPHGEMIDMYNPAVTGAVAAAFNVRLQVHHWNGHAIVTHPIIGVGGPLLPIYHSHAHFEPLWEM